MITTSNLRHSIAKSHSSCAFQTTCDRTREWKIYFTFSSTLHSTVFINYHYLSCPYKYVRSSLFFVYFTLANPNDFIHLCRNPISVLSIFLRRTILFTSEETQLQTIRNLYIFYFIIEILSNVVDTFYMNGEKLSVSEWLIALSSAQHDL